MFRSGNEPGLFENTAWIAASYHAEKACLGAIWRRGNLFDFVHELDADIGTGAPPHTTAALNPISGNVDLHAIEQTIAILEAQTRPVCREIQRDTLL